MAPRAALAAGPLPSCAGGVGAAALAHAPVLPLSPFLSPVAPSAVPVAAGLGVLSAGALLGCRRQHAGRLSARPRRRGSGRRRGFRASQLLAAARVLDPSPRPEWEIRLPQLTAEECHRLHLGQYVQRQERQGPRGSGFVVVDVEAPPSLVLKSLTAFDNYPGMIPVVRHAVVHALGRGQHGVSKARCTYRLSRFGFSVSVVHVVDLLAGLVRFDLDPEAFNIVLHEASGFWHVEPACGGTCSRVWLCVSLRAASLLPSWLVDYVAERALRRATAWLRPHFAQLCASGAIEDAEGALGDNRVIHSYCPQWSVIGR